MLWKLDAAAMLIMSIVTFSLMGADKRRAVQGRWRVRERTLFLCALLMGGVGGTLGMYQFRHKTKHLSFRIIFPTLASAQLLGLFYLMVAGM